MNKIEQEFFEAFGIEPKCLNEEYSGCKYANDDNRKCCKQYKDKTCNYSYFWIYPLITPEIVLGLEDILFRFNCNVFLERTLGTHENKSKPYKSHTGEIKYSKECHFEWCYEIFDLGDYFESEDKTYNDWRVVSQNMDRINALLTIFIKIIKDDDILLNKDEIQDQVKELFNGK